jgi:hypothetical protein
MLGPSFRDFAHLNDPLPSEQQMLRIDVTQLDEPLHLLRAAARIGGRADFTDILDFNARVLAIQFGKQRSTAGRA